MCDPQGCVALNPPSMRSTMHSMSKEKGRTFGMELHSVMSKEKGHTFGMAVLWYGS